MVKESKKNSEAAPDVKKHRMVFSPCSETSRMASRFASSLPVMFDIPNESIDPKKHMLDVWKVKIKIFHPKKS